MANFSANKIDFVLDQVEALANNEEGGAGGGCTSGGEGSTYCFTSWVTIYYDENGNLELKVDHKEDDFTFDEIGSVLKIKELQKTKEELFESLEMFYKVFYLGEDSDDI